MKKSIIKDLFLLLIIVAAIWAIFVVFSKDEYNSPSLFSVEKEEAIGDRLVEQYLKDPQFEEYKNDILDSAVSIVKNRLLDGMDSTEFHYNIYVFDNNMVNGFAMPGGHILLSTGLFEFANSPEEIAAIVAHEMGHVENRHLLSRLSRDIFIMILTGGDNSILSEAARTLSSTAFDRGQEREADDYALNLLEKSEIHPIIIARVFNRMKEEEHGNFNKNLQFLSTHPHHDERVEAAFRYKVAEDFEEEKIDVDWERVKNFRSGSTE